MSAVAVERLTKRFGTFAAVDGISFEVPDGQLLAVLGPNGAGKTTTLEMLEGYLAPTSGTVRVLGADPHRAGRAWRARIGLVLQSTSLDAELTVRDTLRLFARLYPAPRRVGEALELVDLAGDAHTRVGALSGGQRRRVDIAIGVIGRPDVLFLDEPTTGLDPEARRRTWASVENLAATGTTVLLTTHYIDEADHLAERVIVLAGGRIAADTTPRELRGRGGPPMIRYLVPGAAAAASLPPELAAHLGADGRTLLIRTADVAATLRELAGWASRERLDLDSLEVGPPSLEDAYLAVIGDPASPDAARQSVGSLRIPEVSTHD
jgi:ABC-2 type transport system ATP-binding protein